MERNLTDAIKRALSNKEELKSIGTILKNEEKDMQSKEAVKPVRPVSGTINGKVATNKLNLSEAITGSISDNKPNNAVPNILEKVHTDINEEIEEVLELAKEEAESQFDSNLIEDMMFFGDVVYDSSILLKYRELMFDNYGCEDMDSFIEYHDTGITRKHVSILEHSEYSEFVLVTADKIHEFEDKDDFIDYYTQKIKVFKIELTEAGEEMSIEIDKYNNAYGNDYFLNVVMNRREKDREMTKLKDELEYYKEQVAIMNIVEDELAKDINTYREYVTTFDKIMERVFEYEDINDIEYDFVMEYIVVDLINTHAKRHNKSNISNFIEISFNTSEHSEIPSDFMELYYGQINEFKEKYVKELDSLYTCYQIYYDKYLEGANVFTLTINYTTERNFNTLADVKDYVLRRYSQISK